MASTLKKTGLDANKDAAPLHGMEYTATDTSKFYRCYVDGTWTQEHPVAAGAGSAAWKDPARCATITALPNTPSYSSVTKRFTQGGAPATLVVDGVTPAVNDRILVKNQGSDNETPDTTHGLFKVINNDGVAAWVIERTSDADASAELVPHFVVAVQEGTINRRTIWQLNTVAPIVLDTDALRFTELDADRSLRANEFAGQTIGNAAWVAKTYASENYDTDGAYDGTTFTAKARGKYHVTFNPVFVANAIGVRGARIKHNGTEIGRAFAPGHLTEATGPCVCATVDMATPDTLTFEVYQNSGGDLATEGGATGGVYVEKVPGSHF